MWLFNRKKRKDGYVPAEKVLKKWRKQQKKVAKLKDGEYYIDVLTPICTRTFATVEEAEAVEAAEGGIFHPENGWKPCEERISYMVKRPGKPPKSRTKQ